MLWMHKLLALALLMSGCGTEIGNPKKPKTDGSGTQTASLIDDPGVASELIAAQADEVIDAAADDATSAVSLALLDDTGLKITTTCTAGDGGAAVVGMHATGAVDRTFAENGRSGTFTATVDEVRTSTWKHSGDAVGCNEAKDAVVIAWAKADGLTLTATWTDQRSMSITRVGPNGPHTRTGQGHATGERDVTWQRDAAADTDSVIALKKSVTGHLDRTFNSTRDGAPLEVSTHIEVNSGAPVVVAVERDKTSEAWLTKTILSGTVVSSQAGDSHLVSTYENLRFTAGSGCVPDSGRVVGQLFRGSEVAPVRSYVVSFDQGGGTLTYDDGTQYPYVPAFCGLDGKPPG